MALQNAITEINEKGALQTSIKESFLFKRFFYINFSIPWTTLKIILSVSRRVTQYVGARTNRTRGSNK